jgi:hypothetical protein
MSILTGKIGGVIYTDNTLSLVIVGIGGLVGGLINGILLFQAITIGFGSNRARKFNPVPVLAGWALAFIIKEEAYYLALGTGSGLFYGISICSSVIFGNLIAAGVGGGLTMIALDHSFADSITGVLVWDMGLILGFFTGILVTDFVSAQLVYSVPSHILKSISILVGGLVNGCISAMIGGWVMVWLGEKNYPSKATATKSI